MRSKRAWGNLTLKLRPEVIQSYPPLRTNHVIKPRVTEVQRRIFWPTFTKYKKCELTRYANPIDQET